MINFDGIPMSPAIARRAMTFLSETEATISPKENMQDYQLSSREIEILKEIFSGNNPVRIAEKLYQSQYGAHARE